MKKAVDRLLLKAREKSKHEKPLPAVKRSGSFSDENGDAAERLKTVAEEKARKLLVEEEARLRKEKEQELEMRRCGKRMRGEGS